MGTLLHSNYDNIVVPIKKIIIQAGIKEVVYLCDKYANTDSVIASKKLFDTCGVKYRQIEETDKNVILKI